MRGLLNTAALSAALLVSMVCLLFDAHPAAANEADAGPQSAIVTSWSMMWETTPLQWDEVAASEDWIAVGIDQPHPERPAGADGMWIKIDLPPFVWANPALYVEELYAFEVKIYTNEGDLLFEQYRRFTYNLDKVMLPLDQSFSGQSVYLFLKSPGRIGIQSEILVGDFNVLLPQHVRDGLFEIILGCALFFVAAVMLICAVFLRRIHYPTWIALSLVILSTGMILVSYSIFSFSFFPEYETIVVVFFDLGLFIFLPSMIYYYEQLFGQGKFSIIRGIRHFQVGYSTICLAMLVLYLFFREQVYTGYYYITVYILGYLIIFQLAFLIILSLVGALKGNRDAIILMFGFAFFGIIMIIELLWYYYLNGNYDLKFWKWGVIGYVMALIVALGRRIASDHEQVVKYSKELEMYNNQMIKSEKMEIISELAASVAHEVRNPLQVTRGFLQLLKRNSEEKNRGYLMMAIKELDRASEIITDFLTFAKPQLEQITTLDLAEELKHVEGILMPYANMQNGKIVMNIPPGLHVLGNSAKLKQAFLNMAKNSIEAFQEDGEVNIWAYEEDQHISIHIKDNGIGMDEHELMKLGEPYYSNKSKGTGLGMMVTFRIIEVMNGKMEVKSKKGEGTEIIIKLPSADIENEESS